MTVAIKPRAIDYAEDGVSVAFAVPWKFNDPEDVQALRTSAAGVQTPLVYGTDYSVTGGATDAGGELTVTAPAVAGTELSLWNDTARSQTADYETNDTFPAETHEERLDNLAMVTQELDADMDRRPAFPRGAVTIDFADLAGLQNGDILVASGGKLSLWDRAAFNGMFLAGSPAGLVPASGTGNDAALRVDLANSAIGAALVAFLLGDGATARAAMDRLRDRVSLEDFGGAGDGSDNSAAFADAETFAEDNVGALGVIDTPIVSLRHGLFLAGSLVKMSYGWRGQGPDNTKLQFDGVAGANFITQDIDTGRNSSGVLADMTIDGVDCGSILVVPVNAAGYGVDDRYRIENVRFVGGDVQLDLSAGWVNAHFQYLRFDNYNDCAVLLAPYTGQNQANFHLTDFTSDNAVGVVAATATCFARIDLSDYGTTANVGNVVFSNARIEFNNYSLAGNKGVFEILSSVGSGGRQAAITLRDIDIQNSHAGGVSAPFYRSAGGNTHGERYTFVNVTMNGVGSFIFAGDYPTWMKAIPTGNWLMALGDDVNGFVGMRTVSSGATGLEHMAPTSSTVVRQVLVPGEAYSRVIERPDVLLSGSGSVAAAILLRMAGKTGWTVPTGTLSRALADYTATVSGAAYDATVQGNLNALSTQVQLLTRVLAAVLNDLHASGSGSPHGVFRT